jgi:hypothetical protein
LPSGVSTGSIPIPAALRVFDGLAEVTRPAITRLEVKEGHVIALDTLAMHRFDKTVTDALDRWSERRDEYVSMANVSAANTLRSSLFSGGDAMLGRRHRHDGRHVVLEFVLRYVHVCPRHGHGVQPLWIRILEPVQRVPGFYAGLLLLPWNVRLWRRLWRGLQHGGLQ